MMMNNVTPARSASMRRRVGLLALLTSLALVVPVAPIQSAPQQRSPSFRSSANLVRVDVIVRDKDGAIVRGLKMTDFAVTEDGKAQQLTSFDFEEIATDQLPPLGASTSLLGQEQLQSAALRSSTATTIAARPGVGEPAPAAEPAGVTDLPGRRLIVLLFDTSSMQPEEIDRAIKSANQYVDKQMTVADLVAIASVGQSLTILRDFTADRDLLKTTLSAFDVTAGTGFEQPLAAEVADAAEDADPADLPLDDSEFGIFNNDRRLRAMKVLAEALAPIDQKKAILYFSSGISRSGTDNQVELRAVINAANKANTSIYPVDSRGLTAVVPGGAAGGGGGRGGGGGGRGGGGSSVFSGRSMLSQFSSLNSSQETLSTLASDTGGQAFLDTNDFGPAFTRVLRDMSAYYLLGYSSSNSAQDGKFRKISVKLKNTTSGYRLEARNGYYAPADFAHLKKDDKERQLQEQIASAVSLTDVPVVASTAWFRTSSDRFYVPVSLAVPGSSIRVPTDPALDRKNASFDLLGVVTDEQGRSVGRIRDTMQIPAAQVAELANKQIQYQSGVTLPSGHFKVKVAVRENADGAMGTFEFPIVIPDLKAEPVKVSPVVLSTQLRFTRGGGPGGRGGQGGPGGPGGQGGPGGGRGGEGPGGGGRGFASQRGGGGPQWAGDSINPLLRGGQEIVQSLSHVVTTAQQMYFYYEVYDPTLDSASLPRVQTSLAFYRGRVKVFETPVVDRAVMDDPERKAVIFQFQLPGSSLKPGLYTCQVNVIDEVSGRFAFPRLAVYVKENK
ncbi:MAG: VWA domain-containing protein [Vicinamibacterales bacterium]